MAAKYLVYGSRGAKYECDTLKEAKKVAGKYGTIEKVGGPNLTGKAIGASKAKFKTPYRKNPEERDDSDEELIETLHAYSFRPIQDGFHSAFSEDAEYFAGEYAREQGYDPDDIEVDYDKAEEIAKEFSLDFTAGLATALREGLRNYDKERVRNAIKEVIDDSYRAGHNLYLTAAGHGAGFWDGGWEEGDLLTEIAKSCGTPEVFDVLIVLDDPIHEKERNPRYTVDTTQRGVVEVDGRLRFLDEVFEDQMALSVMAAVGDASAKKTLRTLLSAKKAQKRAESIAWMQDAYNVSPQQVVAGSGNKSFAGQVLDGWAAFGREPSGASQEVRRAAVTAVKMADASPMLSVSGGAEQKRSALSAAATIAQAMGLLSDRDQDVLLSHADRVIRNPAPVRGPYKVEVYNGALNTYGHVGKFDTLEEAQEYVEREAERTRSFARYTVVAAWDLHKKVTEPVFGRADVKRNPDNLKMDWGELPDERGYRHLHKPGQLVRISPSKYSHAEDKEAPLEVVTWWGDEKLKLRDPKTGTEIWYDTPSTLYDVVGYDGHVQNPRGVSPAATALYNKRPIGSKVRAAGVVFVKVSNDPHRGGAWEVSGNGAGLKDGEIVPGYAVSRAVTAMVESAFSGEAMANPEAKYRAVGTRGGVYETETLRQAKNKAGRFGTVERIGGASDGLAQKARAKSRQHYGVPKNK